MRLSYESSNYLIHHGVKGQQWGKRYGPPYPLNKNPSVQAQKKKKSRMSYERVYGSAATNANEFAKVMALRDKNERSLSKKGYNSVYELGTDDSNMLSVFQDKNGREIGVDQSTGKIIKEKDFDKYRYGKKDGTGRTYEGMASDLIRKGAQKAAAKQQLREEKEAEKKRKKNEENTRRHAANNAAELSEAEIDDMIRRLQKEKQLKQLVLDVEGPDPAVIKNEKKQKGRNALKKYIKDEGTKLAKGAVSYGLYNALQSLPTNDQTSARMGSKAWRRQFMNNYKKNFSSADFAEIVYNRKNKKKSKVTTRKITNPDGSITTITETV